MHDEVFAVELSPRAVNFFGRFLIISICWKRIIAVVIFCFGRSRLDIPLYPDFLRWSGLCNNPSTQPKCAGEQFRLVSERGALQDPDRRISRVQPSVHYPAMPGF